jgi:CO dehydrogenase maturation factor
MKVLICGKGGSGKSTLSAIIAIAMKNRGYSVLLIDADESNHGLHRMLGISHPVSMLDNLEGKKLKTSFQEIDPICQLIEKFKKNFPDP